MRDVIVALIIFGALPSVLMRPQVGVYLWSWIGYMNPHRLGWGFAYDMPFAALVGIATMVGLVLTKDRRAVPVNAVTVCLCLFIGWLVITTVLAVRPDAAMDQLSKVLKIQVMVFVTMILIRNREHIQRLIWVIALSMGFFGVKGGLFALQTGGQYIVFGPAGSFIEGNNELAFALVMTLPMMWYCVQMSQHKWVKRGLVAVIGLTALSVLASYSRGAFLALAGIAFFLWFKSKGKLPILLGFIVMIPFILLFMPSEWMDRVSSIKDWQADASSMGRIYVWALATKIAVSSPIFGAGFGAFGGRQFHHRFAEEITGDPNPNTDGTYIATDPHSIYFLVLGEHGFVGLALFLLLGVLALYSAGKIVRMARGHEHLTWAGNLGAVLQVSMIGYAIGGTFLGQSYFDLYYHIIALVVVTRAYVEEALATQPVRQPDSLPIASAAHG